MVTIEDVRPLASSLPRSYEVVVRDRVKFRVGRIVYLAFSRDETVMGFAFPKEERDALVASEGHKFLLPGPSDLRYHWVLARLATVDRDELRELVIDAWCMVVPKRVAAAYLSESCRPTQSVDSQPGGIELPGRADVVDDLGPGRKNPAPPVSRPN